MVHMHFCLCTNKQHRELQTRAVDKVIFWGYKVSSLLRQELDSVWRRFSETRRVLIRVWECVYVWIVCENFARNMCHIYLRLSRCYAVKLPLCHWLKQWTCSRMIGWNQLWHCGISQFCFLPDKDHSNDHSDSETKQIPSFITFLSPIWPDIGHTWEMTVCLESLGEPLQK